MRSSRTHHEWWGAAASRPPYGDCGAAPDSNLKKNTSLRGAKRRGDRRECLWCNPLDFAETTNGRYRLISGIATPVCALVRNDVFSFGAGFLRACAGAAASRPPYGDCDERKRHRSSQDVILSEQSESKDLRTYRLRKSHSVRRSFDFGLRPSLRMTDFWCARGDSADMQKDRSRNRERSF